MSGTFGISITGLRAAQVGLSTAGHNITNASTPGYHRQEIVQSTNTPLFTGAGFLGQGTNVDTVKRVYSQFLDKQVQSAQTQSAYLDTYSAQISQIDNMLADPSAGLSPALQEFFQGVHDVAANPASVPSRQSMLSSSEALVSRFQSLDGRLQEMRDGVNSRITSSVGLINSYAQQIANLNHQVVLAEAGGNGQPPNDILDQRDLLVAELNKEINVSVVKQDDGSYNIFMGKGQALVVGQQAMTLSARPLPDDPENMGVAYVNYGGSAQMLPQGSLDGGSLGGLLAFRSETLDKAQNELGRVAIGLAQTFNDQHRLGQDLNGDLGGYYFNVRGSTGVSGQNPAPSAKVVANTLNNPASGVPAVTLSDISNVTSSDYSLVAISPTNFTLTRLSDNTALFTNVVLPQTVDGLTIAAPVPPATANDKWLIQPTRDGARDISVAIKDTAKVAAAAPILASSTYANTGTGRISAGVVNAPPPTNAALQNNVTIAFIDATHFSVTDNTTATVLAASVLYDPLAGASVSYNGWTVALNGTPATGDSFTIGPNTNGVSDNRNALLLAGLQTENTLAGGTATYQSAYSQIVSSIGVKSRDINVTAQAQASLVTQSQQAQQSMSGVNLDEEAANLMRYQQAYEASAKLMQIASTLFDTLLTLGR
ncbi:MAG: flagellar hook-associated protein FlgK [Sulfurimicrobium sp.]|nr:flagellar hook-associated protein FlgK [Sulfurimicrobium sp.]